MTDRSVDFVTNDASYVSGMGIVPADSTVNFVWTETLNAACDALSVPQIADGAVAAPQTQYQFESPIAGCDALLVPNMGDASAGRRLEAGVDAMQVILGVPYRLTVGT